MDILLPMFTLVVFTLIIACVLGAVRFIAVQKREIHPRYFKVFEGEVPEYMTRIARNYSNLLELPLLFYVIGVLLISLGVYDSTLVMLAWAYVISRFAHSAIHILYNNPLHRLIMFSISGSILLAMWILTLMKLA